MSRWRWSSYYALVPCSRGTSGFRPTLAGTACFVGMLASTLTGNVPINKRVLELSPETDGVRGAARALGPAAHLTRCAERGRAGAPVSGSSAGG